MEDVVNQRLKIVTIRTTYGALIVRRHAIPMSGAGNYMENHQVESRDKRENNQVIMVRTMSQQYNRMKQHRKR